MNHSEWFSHVGSAWMIFHFVFCNQRWIIFPKIFCSLWVFLVFCFCFGFFFFLMGIYSLAVKIHLWFKFMKHTYERAGVAGWLFLASGIFSIEINILKSVFPWAGGVGTRSHALGLHPILFTENSSSSLEVTKSIQNLETWEYFPSLLSWCPCRFPPCSSVHPTVKG